MDLSPYVETLREGLATAASAGDEQTRRTAALLSAALEPAARLAIMNALSDLAAEVTAELDDQLVELRLDGREVRVVVTGGPEDVEPEPEPEPLTGDGDISRITLRLFEELKAKAEQAAAAQGVSLNTFVAQAVQGAVHRRSARGGYSSWQDVQEDLNDIKKDWKDAKRDWKDRHRGGRGSRLRGWVEG
jgi:uncharacterized protein (DUF1778 family)